jgi:hypothetical protein
VNLRASHPGNFPFLTNFKEHHLLSAMDNKDAGASGSELSAAMADVPPTEPLDDLEQSKKDQRRQ